MPSTKASDNGCAARVVPVEFLAQVAAEHEQAIADIALQFLFAEDLSHGAGGLPSPHLQLEQSIPSDVIALREKQVRFVLGVDMRNAPAVLDDLNRLAETGDE